MPDIPSLSQLVTAISSAVLEAQEKIEAAQVASLMSYFKRKPGHRGFFPVTMKVNLPSQRPDAPSGSTDLYQVPYLSVLPYSALRIKKADVDFDVSFNALDMGGDNTPGAALQNGDPEHPPMERAEHLPNLTIDMGAHKKSSSFTAHVHLSLEGVDLSEGAARLINELIKTNQTYEHPAPSGEPAAASSQATVTEPFE